LKATGTPANQGTAQVTLSWTGSTGATSYNVYRSLNGSGEGGTPLATGVTGTSYTDTATAFGTTYFYKVTAVGAGGESALSNEASTTPLLAAHVHFTSDATEAPAGYLADTGLTYGPRAIGLTYGWNQDNTVNMRDRDSAASPDELHDGLGHMQKPNNPSAWWGLAVPNGTYSVHLLSGDPNYIDSVYEIAVGATRSGSTFSGGVLAINGVPTATHHWFANTVTVTVTGGVLYVSKAPGASNNKINAIDITQVLPGVNSSTGYNGATGPLKLNGSAKYNGTKLELTDGKNNEAGSAFTSTRVDVAKFQTQFNFQITNPNADGIAFVLQSVGATALGAAGGGLGYQGIASSVAVKFDLYNNSGEGVNSTGLYVNGAAPTTPSTDLTGTGIDLHSGHVFTVALIYNGTTLTVTITDTTTKASAKESYTVDIVSDLGGQAGFVGFTGGTGGLTATQDILAWQYHPTP
jgi:hypothetical protein